MTSSKLDFTKLFEFPTLPKIHGEPTYKQLKELKNKLKTNATKISSELGGGNFGHLGLVLSDEEYALISNVPYIEPEHPGAIVLPVACSERTENRRRDEHEKALALFHETLNLKNALKKQLSEAIDDLYLEELRDPTTNTILLGIPEILEHLFNNYGDIDADAITEKETEIRNMTFTISDPLSKLYKQIEDLDQLSTAAGAPYSQRQLTNIAIHIIKKTNDYQRALEDWYSKPLDTQTWPNLKTHFQTARKSIRQLRGKSMLDSSFHATNAITSKIKNVQDDIQTLQNGQQQVLNAIMESQSLMTNVANHIENTIDDNPQNIDLSPSQQANATTNTNKDLTDIIRTLQKEINDIKYSQTSNSRYPFHSPTFPPPPYTYRPRPYNKRDIRTRSIRKNLQTKNKLDFRSNTSKYCWSHGACAHTSNQCRNPKLGHKWDATFADKKGGCTHFCPT